MRAKFILTMVLWFSVACLGIAASASAQDPANLPGLNPPATQADPYKVSAQFTTASEGKPARLFVTVEVAEGWHVYSTTQPPGGPVRTKIALDAQQPGKLTEDFKPTKLAEKHPEPAFNNLIVETHAGAIAWYAPLELAAGSDPKQAVLKGKIFLQACTKLNCLPPKNLAFEARLGPGGALPESGTKHRHLRWAGLGQDQHRPVHRGDGHPADPQRLRHPDAAGADLLPLPQRRQTQKSLG